MQKAHVFSPPSPASLRAAVKPQRSIRADSRSLQLYRSRVFLPFPTSSYKPISPSPAAPLVFTVGFTSQPPAFTATASHFLETDLLGFTGFQLLLPPSGAAPARSPRHLLTHPVLASRAATKSRNSQKHPGVKIHLISCQPGPAHLFLWA